MPKRKRYLDNGGKPDRGFLDYVKSGVKAIANEVIGDKTARRRMISDLQDFGILPRGGENGQVHAVVAPGITDMNKTSPVHLANNFIKNNKNKSKYIVDIAEDIYGLNPNLQIVDYNAMNKYGKVFNKRIKKTLPLAKQRGTLRTDKNPNIIVADNEGRKILYDKFINDTPTLKWDNTIHVGDPITNKGKLAKEYYYKSKPAESVYDSNPTSFADRKNNTIVLIPKDRNYKNMYKYTLPHEKTHIFIDAKKEAELFGTDRGLTIPKHRPGDIDIERDIYLSTPTEQLARGTQIKNYLGITDESPITAKQLKYASENYVKDTGYDNNMTDFFNMITDYNKAAKWLSNAPIVTPFLVGATGYGMYRDNKRNGGRISLRNGGRLQFRGGGKKPITTGGAGYVPENNGVKAVKDAVYNYVTGGLPISEVRQRLYNNIVPHGYGDVVSRVRNAVVNNKKEERFMDFITNRYRKNLWAEYLQIPKNKREYAFYDVENSPYRPTIADNKRIKYKRITSGNNLGIPSNMWWDVYDELADKKEGSSKLSLKLGDFFGHHTISRGHEKGKGSYISYYDVWDLSPFRGNGRDESQGIGKPIHLYDRAYLDDLFNVEDKDKGAYWLPEIEIRGNRKTKADGGSIHIAPSKRGTFTAAATRHGMGVQEFANTVLRNKDRYSPSLVKKANFARNASKWNH